MNKWNRLLHEAVKEFPHEPTHTVRVRTNTVDRKTIYRRVALGVVVEILLFALWLTNADVTGYLIITALFGIAYMLWMLMKV